MDSRLREVLSAGRKRNLLLSVLFPVILLSGLSIVFTSSSYDGIDCCGHDSMDCCGGGVDENSQGCGVAVQAKRAANLTMLKTASLKSGETDMRCGMRATWSYHWLDDPASTQRPPIKIWASNSKSGSNVEINANESDKFTGGSWQGSYESAMITKTFSDPMPVYLSVKAQLMPDLAHILDSVDINMNLTYYKLKR